MLTYQRLIALKLFLLITIFYGCELPEVNNQGGKKVSIYDKAREHGKGKVNEFGSKGTASVSSSIEYEHGKKSGYGGRNWSPFSKKIKWETKYGCKPQKGISFSGGEKFDLFKPLELKDKRPTIVFFHSGGFITGSKENPIITKYAKDFARKGFVTVSTNYQLIEFDGIYNKAKLAVRNKEEVKDAIYGSINDARLLVNHLYNNAEQYQIDTGNIFLAGFSAGAIVALNAGYMDNVEAETWFGRRFTSPNFPTKLKGIIAMGGAMLDSSHLDDTDGIPLLLMHGTNDLIVDTKIDHPFNKYVKDYRFGLPGLFYEMGLTMSKNDDIYKLTIGGLKVTAEIEEWIPEIIQLLFTFPLHGSEEIYDQHKKSYLKDSITYLEFKKGSHCFMRKDSKGGWGAKYEESVLEIHDFVTYYSTN